MKTDTLPVFENTDTRIRHYHLVLERIASDIPHYELPNGFHFTTYSAGDKESWFDIEQSAHEIQDRDDGEKQWNRYFAPWEDLLPERMFFIETDSGEKVGTASAYFDIDGSHSSDPGWLHWVAIKREYQGRGLARPLIAHTLETLCRFGYKRLVVSTQTNTWLAVRLYLDFGFLPTEESAKESLTGWKIIKRLTAHPSLAGFENASDGEVLS